MRRLRALLYRRGAELIVLGAILLLIVMHMVTKANPPI